MRVFDVFRTDSFEALIERWMPLTLALNDINRSMGHDDFYPFAMPEAAITKLAFVHRIVHQLVQRAVQRAAQRSGQG